MKIVPLVSGGIDSSLMTVLMRDEGHSQMPLFVDYGQRAVAQEWKACEAHHKRFDLPLPKRADLSNYGRLIPSGLTDPSLDLVKDAFLPGRNMLFLLAGASYARAVDADAVAIGLLNEETHIFPDQTIAFLQSAESVLTLAVDKEVKILAPLQDFHKCDVIALADSHGIIATYSCHKGDNAPCGECIACGEFQPPTPKENK